jgi:predicted RNA-binding protein
MGLILRLKVVARRTGDDVINEDLIFLYGKANKIITKADILGSLLRRIVKGGEASK